MVRTFAGTRSRFWFSKRFKVLGSADLLRRMCGELQAAHITPVLVALPIHPRSRGVYTEIFPRFEVEMTSLAQQYKGLYWNAADLLTESDYADHIHPNEVGREKYSTALGREMARLPALNDISTPALEGAR